MAIESEERQHCGLDRRLKKSRLGTFKPMADFDWKWATKVDPKAIESVFHLRFVDECANVLLVGPNGIGKTMIGKKFAHAVVKTGRTARFTTASTMLTELTAQDGTAALHRTFRQYRSPGVTVIDELGYIAYGNRHADVLFEVVNRRYEMGRSIIVTTNRAFTDWGELFPKCHLRRAAGRPARPPVQDRAVRRRVLPAERGAGTDAVARGRVVTIYDGDHAHAVEDGGARVARRIGAGFGSWQHGTSSPRLGRRPAIPS